MSRTATTHFEPRHVPEVDRDRRFGVIDRRFEDRVRAATDHIGRGTWDGVDRRKADRRNP